MRLWVLASVALVACSDPAEWRPAKNAKEYSSSKDAFRVQEAPMGCETIGYVTAEDTRTPIDDLAKTAANHGGTHYVVFHTSDDPELVSTTSGTARGGVFVASSRSHVEHHRSMRAEVYRCPP